MPHLFLLFFFTSSIAAQLINNGVNCPSFQCNGVTISYPFWKTDDPTATNCGYQGFGINCSTINDREIPTFDLGNDTYYVQEISYNRNNLILVNYAVSPAASVVIKCPRLHHNINVETLPMKFTRLNVNLTFHFNCTGDPSFATRTPCLDSGIRRSYVSNFTSEMEDSDWNGYSCEENVETTVLHYDMIEALHDLSTEFSQVLGRGFQLSWGRTGDCEKCEDSDGQCGHDKDSNEIMCLCSDGTWSTGVCKGTFIRYLFKILETY